MCRHREHRFCLIQAVICSSSLGMKTSVSKGISVISGVGHSDLLGNSFFKNWRLLFIFYCVSKMKLVCDLISLASLSLLEF